MDTAGGGAAEVSAGHVVIVRPGDTETPRLLLVSTSDAHPKGLGNAADQVGRHLQGHLYLSTFGIFETPVIDAVGPNVRIATCDHIHSRPGVLGGVLANDILKLPIIHWNWALPPDAARTGLAGKAAMSTSTGTRATFSGQFRKFPHQATG